eukprot:3631871-Pyramimonas_sp.AAC.1
MDDGQVVFPPTPSTRNSPRRAARAWRTASSEALPGCLGRPPRGPTSTRPGAPGLSGQRAV